MDWFRIGTFECCCEHGYEPSCVRNGGKFLVLPRDCYLQRYIPA